MAASDPTATLYLRSLPRRLVREVKAAAARSGSTLTGFVRESLERSVEGPSRAPSSDEEFDLDRAWYERNLAKVRARHEGRYVAVIGGAIVDHDEDFAALAERVFARFGVRSIFMPRVGPAPATVRVRSPRLVRA